MSVTNLIDDGNVTIVQGINGIRLFSESWVHQRKNNRSRQTSLDQSFEGKSSVK